MSFLDFQCKDHTQPLFKHRPLAFALISPSGCLQYQRDVVQSGLIDDVLKSRDSDVTLPDVFMAIEVAA